MLHSGAARQPRPHLTDTAEAVRRLKALGTAQNRKVYTRHGVQGDAFGVSYANLGKLRREVGTDHELA